MAVELRWVASSAASCFHVAAALARGVSPAQPEAFAAFQEPVAALSGAIESLEVPAWKFFDRLVPLAASYDDNRLLAEAVLSKVGRTSAATAVAGEFAGLFSDLKRVQAKSQPKLLDELELRAGPLREQWEGRGPGMLAGIRRLTDPNILVERADVLVVYPMAGGGGTAHLAHNVVSIEAVLANPSRQLPEIVRLAWLIGQLNLDLPRHSESLQNSRRVAALAMIPPALAAAQDVELVQDDPATLALALQIWQPAGGDESSVAECLGLWWKTWLQTRENWPAALAALEQMLADAQTGDDTVVEPSNEATRAPGAGP